MFSWKIDVIVLFKCSDLAGYKVLNIMVFRAVKEGLNFHQYSRKCL